MVEKGHFIMISPEEQNILTCIPSLRKNKEYKVTSPVTRDYNCIAWALGRTDFWYWPYLGNTEHEDDEYWPENVPDNTLIESFVLAIKTEGFELCQEENVEEGYTKIVLYELNGNCTHASRLLPSGLWTSKMGPLHDIQHTSPYSIEGKIYGKVYCFMKRKNQ